MRLIVCALAMLFLASGHAEPASPQEDDIYSALLSWAVKLSGYPRPAVAPVVQFVPQEFFNENACHGRVCRVWGWYPNTGGNVVYVHEAVRDLISDSSNQRSLLAASIIVHEFTHYLQAAQRGFAQYGCGEALELERQAYSVQNAYIVGYGRLVQVGLAMHNASCAGSASESVIPDSNPAMDPVHE